MLTSAASRKPCDILIFEFSFIFELSFSFTLPKAKNDQGSGQTVLAWRALDWGSLCPLDSNRMTQVARMKQSLLPSPPCCSPTPT